MNSPESPSNGSRYDGKWMDVIIPLFGIVFYAIPCVIILLPEILSTDSVPNPIPWLGVWPTWMVLMCLPIVFGICFFLWSAARSGGQDTNVDDWPLVERPAVSVEQVNDNTLNVLIAEYQTVAEEARYRDRLLLRTGYFSLAAFSVLITIYIRVGHPQYQAGIAMIGTLIALAFAIAVVSYKDARDPLWERMRVLELSEPLKHKLTSFHTIRTRGERRLFDHLSLSGYIVTLQIFFLLMWFILYLVTSFLALGSWPSG